MPSRVSGSASLALPPRDGPRGTGRLFRRRASMNRLPRAALTGALLLMLVGATLAEDRVMFHNRTTKKDDEVRGKIEEETPGGIKIKEKRSKKTQFVPARDIQQVIYDTPDADAVTFRTPDGKQNA